VGRPSSDDPRTEVRGSFAYGHGRAHVSPPTGPASEEVSAGCSRPRAHGVGSCRKGPTRPTTTSSVRWNPCAAGESACRRDSVHRSLAGVRLCDHPSLRPTRGCPEGRTGRPCPLLGLAPGGGCRAAGVTPDAGALLPHRFTLTCADPGVGHRRSVLCCPEPSDRSDLALASTLPCGVPTFLDVACRPRRRATPRSPDRLTSATSVAPSGVDAVPEQVLRCLRLRDGPRRARRTRRSCSGRHG
jgi:hypothetical protein